VDRHLDVRKGRRKKEYKNKYDRCPSSADNLSVNVDSGCPSPANGSTSLTIKGGIRMNPHPEPDMWWVKVPPNNKAILIEIPFSKRKGWVGAGFQSA